jgi:hypothetical protein
MQEISRRVIWPLFWGQICLSVVRPILVSHQTNHLYRDSIELDWIWFVLYTGNLGITKNKKHLQSHYRLIEFYKPSTWEATLAMYKLMEDLNLVCATSLTRYLHLKVTTVLYCSILHLLHAAFLLGLFFGTENGSDMFFWNVGWIWTDYMALHPRRQNSS